MTIIDNHLSCDQCLILLMINRNDYSFDWRNCENDIKTLKDKGYVIWERCSTAKITNDGYKRIETMVRGF